MYYGFVARLSAMDGGVQAYLQKEDQVRVLQCLHHVYLTRKKLVQVVGRSSPLRDDLYCHIGMVGLRIGLLQSPAQHNNTIYWHRQTVADQQRGHWGPGPRAPGPRAPGAPQILNFFRTYSLRKQAASGPLV